MKFKVHGNVYGNFTDPYLVAKGKKNPHMMILKNDGKIAETMADLQNFFILMDFGIKSYPNDFNAAEEVGLTKTTSVKDYCPKDCPNKAGDGGFGMMWIWVLFLWLWR